MSHDVKLTKVKEPVYLRDCMEGELHAVRYLESLNFGKWTGVLLCPARWNTGGALCFFVLWVNKVYGDLK